MIQVGLEGVPPFTGVALRFALAGGLLLAVARARGIPLGKRRHEHRLWWANGMLGFALAYGIVYWSEQWVPSGLAAVLWAVYPLIISIMAHFFLPAERLRRVDVMRVGVARIPARALVAPQRRPGMATYPRPSGASRERV